MRAMILAAGLGTRLQPLTDARPKALVEIGGKTLLEITLERLREYGVREVIINVHHFADMMTSYLEAHQNFGMNIALSREDVLLDTGGGLKKAGHFFVAHDEPFIVHNVDILTSIDLGKMVAEHRERQALVTMAVQQRTTSRSLLFDEQLQLCGRHTQGGEPEMVRAAAHVAPLAFAGIHIVSPQLFACMSEAGAFSIIPVYLRLAGEGKKIMGFRADEYYWRDLGTVPSLAQAETELRHLPMRQRPRNSKN